MNDEQQIHSPQHQEVLQSHVHEQQQVTEVLAFIRRYAKPAAIVICTLALIVLVDRFLKTQRFKKEAKAEALLMAARSPDQLRAIIENYGSTPSGPVAIMSLGRERFNAGDIAAAQKLYGEFLQKNRDHELALQAELNLITCREALEQLGDAHLLYGEFAAKHRDSYLAPVAILGQARCLEELGMMDEARKAYEDLLPHVGWSDIAEARLKLVSATK